MTDEPLKSSLSQRERHTRSGRGDSQRRHLRSNVRQQLRGGEEGRRRACWLHTR